MATTTYDKEAIDVLVPEGKGKDQLYRALRIGDKNDVRFWNAFTYGSNCAISASTSVYTGGEPPTVATTTTTVFKSNGTNAMQFTTDDLIGLTGGVAGSDHPMLLPMDSINVHRPSVWFVLYRHDSVGTDEPEFLMHYQYGTALAGFGDGAIVEAGALGALVGSYTSATSIEFDTIAGDETSGHYYYVVAEVPENTLPDVPYLQVLLELDSLGGGQAGETVILGLGCIYEHK